MVSLNIKSCIYFYQTWKVNIQLTFVYRIYAQFTATVQEPYLHDPDMVHLDLHHWRGGRHLLQAQVPQFPVLDPRLAGQHHHVWVLSSKGIWLSGKTLACRPKDCEFDPPSLQLKLLIGDMYWFFPEKMLPCISALHF